GVVRPDAVFAREPPDRLRTDAPVLLPGAPDARSPVDVSAGLHPVRSRELPAPAGAVDGRILAALSAGLRLQPARDVRHMDRGGGGAVPALPLVRPPQAATPGFLAELSLTWQVLVRPKLHSVWTLPPAALRQLALKIYAREFSKMALKSCPLLKPF